MAGTVLGTAIAQEFMGHHLAGTDLAGVDHPHDPEAYADPSIHDAVGGPADGFDMPDTFDV